MIPGIKNKYANSAIPILNKLKTETKLDFLRA